MEEPKPIIHSIMEMESHQTHHKKSCSVPNCGLRDQKLFQLPKNEPLRSEWISLCHVSNSTKRCINVCARHFKPEDFSVKCVQRARLTRRAKPSLYLPLQAAAPKERRRCLLPGCQKGRKDGVTLHVFPRLEERCIQWQKLCNLEKTPTRGMNICSRHFLPDDFTLKGGVQVLKKSATPSQNLNEVKITVNPREHIDTLEVVPELSPPGSVSNQSSLQVDSPESSPEKMTCDIVPDLSVCTRGFLLNNSEHASSKAFSTSMCIIKTEPDEKLNPIHKPEVPLETLHNDEDESDLKAEVSKEDDFVASVIPSHFNQVHGKTLSDDCECVSSLGQSKSDFSSKGGTGVQDGRLPFTLFDLMKGDAQLKAFLGVSSATLENLTELALEQISKANFSQKEPFMKEKIALTLCRLRLKLSFECLAALFSIDRWLCGQYFASTVRLLALVLQGAVYWPSKEEISHNMPRCFSRYHDTRVVLGCTKIFVKVPNCLKCRRRLFTFTHYKDAQSVKIMVGVAPSGVITFLSKVCGGKVPDHQIFAESDLITKNMVEPRRDAVMADKDFGIDDVCTAKSIKLYRVPFVRRDKRPLDSENVGENLEITLAKVHVEMAIQRLKTFKILTGKLTLSEIPYIDDIFTVISGIVNLNLLE